MMFKYTKEVSFKNTKFFKLRGVVSDVKTNCSLIYISRFYEKVGYIQLNDHK